MSKGEKMMLKIGLKIASLCVLVLLAACGSEASRQNPNEEISAPTYAPTVAGVLAATGTTWQEAYAALLKEFASQRPSADYYWEWERHFLLHDIDNSGIPELFLMERSMYGIIKYYAIYTFINDQLTPLEFQSVESWGGIQAPLDDRAFIVNVDDSVGMGTIYRRWDIEGLKLVTTAQGHAVTLNEAGREKLNDLENWRHSYELFYLHITTDGWANRQLVSVQEFESIFLRRDERRRLEILPITDTHIEQFIFGNAIAQ